MTYDVTYIHQDDITSRKTNSHTDHNILQYVCYERMNNTCMDTYIICT